MDSAQARFTDLYQAHYREVLGYLIRRTAGSAIAQDLAEEVFVVAWRKLSDVPDGEQAAYWLFGVARKTLAAHNRTVSNRRRIARRWLTGGESDPAAQPETVVVRREDDRLVLEALGRLREQDRELILLAYWDELPHAAIADLLGITRGNVDVRLHRAIRRLGKELGRSNHVWTEGLLSTAPKESEC
ncbi:MAG: sigma-70 family RNA polymerase sigma factor [Acidimicrobiia bacterium]|nr:sigma-70 family RNA polymerase sigma factor [Acidimicrobiia bacterium]